MRLIFCTRLVDIPDGVTVGIASRIVTVTGPLGTLKNSFKHMSLDIQVVEDGKKVKVDLWFGDRATIAAIRTVCSHISNMIKGVTYGFKYKMRFCYAHFPINVACNSDTVEIRNFLGEKKVRRVKLLEGVKYVRTSDVKDQIELSGIDIAKVSLTCANIQQATQVRNKDIRKFLDGIYVSEKTTDLVDEKEKSQTKK
mmetsp:Transcript_28448/g.28770  ORF Transcript_28448/g.28770 Transcript_28448/m.28770 type:complete len:197 (-) Transcript_28448:55-645(-)|eukprot:CAMPEP_0182423422 /NCGR_PEP_ID=MMETSP1167-20130531/9410_1 /TAXON_ID=2988 /ORGANISM="Mallomonas Sp, Strain CCMP3275" /LENGTH=196 /DNA_ID=CAMNT_0024602383 /DNA_START=59 /DNA_END=649 /DNA_ORIENTATION=-